MYATLDEIVMKFRILLISLISLQREMFSVNIQCALRVLGFELYDDNDY